MMPSQAWILLGCLLLSVVLGSQGYHLKLTVVRRPGNQYCADVRCIFDSDDKNDAKFDTRRITIFDITQPSTRGKIASQSQNEDLYIDPNRVDELKGESSISKYHADLTLNLKDPTDCTDELFQCEVEFLNSDGKMEVIQKSITSTTRTSDADDSDQRDTSRTFVSDNEDDPNCQCSLITYQFQRLNDMATEAERKLAYATDKDKEFTDELVLLRNDSKNTAEEITRLEHGKEVQEQAVNELQSTDKEIQGQTDSLRRNDAAVSQEIEVMKRKDQATNEDLARLKNRDKETDKEIGDLKRADKNQDETLNNITHRQSIAREDIDQLEHRDSYFDSELNELKKNNNDFKKNVETLTDREKSMEKQINDLRKNDKSINQGLNELRKNDTVISRDVKELAKKDKQLLEETAKLRHANTIFQDDLAQFRRVDNDNNEHIDRLRQNDVVIAEEITVLKSRDNDFTRNIEELLETDDSLQKQIDDLEEKDASVDVELVNLRARSTAQYEDLTALKVTDKVLDEQITRMSINGAALGNQVNDMWSQHRLIDEGLVVLSVRVSDIEHFINSSQVTTVTRTTTNLVQTTCTRGMVHDQTRARFLLHGVTPALCDTETDGGGWIVIQRRTVGDVDFDRDWSQYKTGFGNPSTDFYMGNDLISNLTKQGFNELRVDMVFQGANYFAHYLNFQVGSESTNYKLSVSDYRGSAGDALTYHNRMEFTTSDRDNDESSDNCATKGSGGWWYKSCYRGNLNGRWATDARDGMIWDPLSDTVALTMTEVKIRLVV